MLTGRAAPRRKYTGLSPAPKLRALLPKYHLRDTEAIAAWSSRAERSNPQRVPSETRWRLLRRLRPPRNDGTRLALRRS